jgi:hypothetical protein
MCLYPHAKFAKDAKGNRQVSSLAQIPQLEAGFGYFRVGGPRK